MGEPEAEQGPEPVVTCAGCGEGAEGPPVTWSTQNGSRGISRLCERCTRENLRSIEGRLDEAWW